MFLFLQVLFIVLYEGVVRHPEQNIIVYKHSTVWFMSGMDGDHM